LYAAQFFEQADRELGGLHQRFTRGEFNLLRRWLRAKIHLNGQRYTAAELCERITGATLSHAPLMRHLRSKYDALYSPDSASLEDLDVAPAPAVASAGVLEGYGLAETADTAVFSTSPMSGAASTGASVGLGKRPVLRKKSGGKMTALIMVVGIVGGGVLGLYMGLIILLQMGKDPFKAKDKWFVPGFLVPDSLRNPTQESVEEPAPGGAGPDSSVRREAPIDVGRALTQRVLATARTRSQTLV
jgi:hypothetical protein